MQINLFAEETQLQRLSELGDSLEKLNVIDFESFRPLLEKVNCKERKSKAGRPSYDVVMMFKILVLQRLFNLSDDQTEGNQFLEVPINDFRFFGGYSKYV